MYMCVCVCVCARAHVCWYEELVGQALLVWALTRLFNINLSSPDTTSGGQGIMDANESQSM